MARKIEHLPLVDLVPNDRNPKAHDVDLIDQSVGRFGFVEPVVMDGRTGKIISGHGRAETLRAMESRGDSPPDGVGTNKQGQWTIPTVTGWASRTDTEANAALIALNRSGEMGGWVDDSLLDLLEELSDLEDGYAGVGFDDESIEDLREKLAALDEDSADSEFPAHWSPDVGEKIALADVSWGEPLTEVHHGEVWQVGSHLVVVARVADEHTLWARHLDDGRRFAPYPEPYLLLSQLAEDHPLLAVQPNKYLAGHLIDKWVSVHGDTEVTRKEQQ